MALSCLMALSRLRPTMLAAAFCLAVAPAMRPAVANTVDFDELVLAPESYWNGPDPGGDVVDGPFGPEVHGSFESHGVAFVNRYDQTFGTWNGFAYSNTSDNTTPGFANQHSAYTGTGAGPGADNYGVGFGYLDLVPNQIQDFAFDPSNPDHLVQLPYFDLPDGYQAASMLVTNTTYAALSMLLGDGFAKQFGGPSGDDPDYLKLTAYGTDAGGTPLGASAEFFLADYRFADNGLDYVVSDWTLFDLSPLAAAKRIYFNLESTDVGNFGSNTPTYFAVDNVEIVAVPEPSGLALGLAGASCAAGLARRRRRAVAR